MALAYDAGKVISKAVNSASCSSINGSAVTSQDTAAILNCIKQVKAKSPFCQWPILLS